MRWHDANANASKLELGRCLLRAPPDPKPEDIEAAAVTSAEQQQPLPKVLYTSAYRITLYLYALLSSKAAIKRSPAGS